MGGVLGGKLCVLVLEKFLVFYGHTVQIYFTGFDLSFCALFVLWLDQFLDIFVITLHTQRNNTTWQLYLWPSNWPVFNTEMGCSTLRPWPLHVQGRSLRAAVFLTAPVLSLIVPQLSELFFKPLQTFIQDTLLDWMEGGNAPPAKMILWTKGPQKVHLRRSPEQHPFPGAPRHPTEPRGPSVSSTSTALSNHPPLVWSARKLSDLPTGSPSKV